MMIERARTSESLAPCMSALPSDTACGGSPPTLTMAAAPSRQSEDAEQMDVLVGAAGELAAEQRGRLFG